MWRHDCCTCNFVRSPGRLQGIAENGEGVEEFNLKSCFVHIRC